MGEESISRRAVLSGVATVAVVGPARAKTFDDVERAARVLADAMQELHGGVWSIQISHTSTFVSVSRDLL